MYRTNIIITILLTLLLAVAGALYYKYIAQKQDPTTPAVTIKPLRAVKKPIVHYLVPQIILNENDTANGADKTIEPKTAISKQNILAAVKKSDYGFEHTITNLMIDKNLFSLIKRENFIQKFVVTIDNLTNKQLPATHLPLNSPGGKFLVAGTTAAPQASTINYSRYSNYVNLLSGLNPTAIIEIYTYFYPLFQAAYQQLGYKNSYFNDRLVTVIDHLLETPNPPDHIHLEQPEILYTYANHSLEKLSAMRSNTVLSLSV